MVAIYLDEHTNVEQALQEFRTAVAKEKIISTYKEKMYYEPPSVRKRKKREKARKLKRFLAKKYFRRPSDAEIVARAIEKEKIERRVKEIKSAFAKLGKKVRESR